MNFFAPEENHGGQETFAWQICKGVTVTNYPKVTAEVHKANQYSKSIT